MDIPEERRGFFLLDILPTCRAIEFELFLPDGEKGGAVTLMFSGAGRRRVVSHTREGLS
jgi:hypothetical protein